MSLVDVLEISAISMVIVFVCLLAISYILELFKVLFYKEENKGVKINQTERAITKNENIKDIKELDEEVLVALFTAAIAASNGKSISNLRIKNFRKVS